MKNSFGSCAIYQCERCYKEASNDEEITKCASSVVCLHYKDKNHLQKSALLEDQVMEELILEDALFE
eukprot:CAMPEP_0117429912 /NCGR_PEP_ID=MMETSP0758-20121206/9450_1 /TAXON_ID=63605 /ORGANISM="Percolomonas cosmopolitus, Strain AE-1 (ATCC 50343)" /LENGTH=66 /DNA_ID=CAMNT_0005217403 /DNA_START=191 /DNA_END=391 /DNA_ORIENTATION=+